MTDSHPASPQIVFTFLLTALAGILWWTFSHWTATSFLSFPQFLIALFALFGLPGTVVLRLLRLRVTFLEGLVVGLFLGMIITGLLYWLLALAGWPALLWGWILLCTLVATRAVWQERIDLGALFAQIRYSHSGLLVILALGWIPLLVRALYYQNFSWTEAGAMFGLLNPNLLLHTSLAAELTHTIPPQVPFLAGEMLNYHVGMDLIAAILNRFGGLSIMDLTVRFCPTLFISLDMLAVFCVARRFTGSAGAGSVAALLAVLGEDLGFIPGLLSGIHSGAAKFAWCAYYFSAPTIVSLYIFNPMVVAHGLLFTSLLCLYHLQVSGRKTGWIIACALTSVALLQTKIFIFINLALSLGIVVVVGLLVARRSSYFWAAAGIAVASLPFVIHNVSGNAGRILWVPYSGIRGYVIPAFERADWPVLAAYPALGLVVYLVMTYGVRVFGAGELLRSFRLSRESSFNFLLAVYVVLGPILSLTTKVAPAEAFSSYNNAIWFMVGSKYVAWLFAVLALNRLWNRVGWTLRIVLGIVVLVGSLTSTIQYFKPSLDYTWGRRNLSNQNPALVEAIHLMKREALPGQVVLSTSNELILAMTELRVPYFALWPFSFASKDEIARRSRDYADFWKAWEAGQIREDILRTYKVSWILCTSRSTQNTLRGAKTVPLETLQINLRLMKSDTTLYSVTHTSNRQLSQPPADTDTSSKVREIER